MTSVRAGSPAAGTGERGGGDAGPAVQWLALRQVRRGAGTVLVLAVGMSTLVAVQYRVTFADAFDPAAFQALAENPAIRTLFGEPVALDDPGGFTVWRVGTFVALLVGVWTVLTATRITRGEEDAGRWDLLLAARLPLRWLLARHLAVLAGLEVVIGAGVAVAMVLAGTAVTGSLLYGAVVGLVGVGSVGLGGLAAQVFPDRRSAAGAGVAVLLAGLLARMVGDGVPALGWLLWLSPFGLLARVQPYAADAVPPLLVLGAGALGLCGLAVLAGARRDLRGGLLHLERTRAPRTALLGSLPGFAVRRAERGLVGWALGIGAYFLLIGLLAASMTDFLAANPRFAELAAEAGFAELGSVPGYAAALLGLLGVPVGAYAATRLAADAADEAERRLTMLFALPVSRVRWALVSAFVSAAGAAVLCLAAGVAMWVGTAVVAAPLRPGEALAGALNAMPVALLCVGAALLALGWLPQAVLGIGSLPATGGFLLHVLADSFGWPGWVASLSPFAHVASVPAEPVDWPGATGLVAVAVGLGALGLVGYRRRDLRG